MKRLETQDELLTLFDEDLAPRVNAMLTRGGVSGMVVFENLDMSSSQLGMRSGVLFGPSCEMTDWAQAADRHLNDLPSQRQYPRYVYIKPSSH